MPKYLNVIIIILIRKGGAKHKRLSHGELAVMAYELRKRVTVIVTKRVDGSQICTLRNDISPLTVPTY